MCHVPRDSKADGLDAKAGKDENAFLEILKRVTPYVGSEPTP